MRMLWLVVLALFGASLISATGFAVSIPVLDSSFEDLVRPVMSVPQSPRTWERFSGGGAAGIQVQNPPLTGQQGQDVGYLEFDSDPGFAVQLVDAEKLRAGTYTATVAVAKQPGAEPSVQPFKIKFEAVGFGKFGTIGGLVSEFAPTMFNSTSFVDVTHTVTVAPDDPNLSERGSYFRLTLVTDGPPEAATSRYLLDNARVTFTPQGGSPEPVYLGESSFEPFKWFRFYWDGNNAGQFRPAAPLFTNQTGAQLGYLTMSDLGGEAALFQDHTTIQAGTYSLKANIGLDATALPTESSFVVLKLEAFDDFGFKELIGQQSMFLASEFNTTTLTQKLNTVVVEAGSVLVGKKLRSVLSVQGGELNLGTYFFDDIAIDFTPAAGLAGDYNANGVVDAADYVLWRNDPTSFGGAAGYDTWRASFGLTSGGPGVGSDAGSVPEPSALLLMAVSAIGCAWAGRRRAIRG